MLAAEGRLLIVTITSNDLDWATGSGSRSERIQLSRLRRTGRPGWARARQRNGLNGDSLAEGLELAPEIHRPTSNDNLGEHRRGQLKGVALCDER